MLVELGLVEQRYKAVLEVLDGAVSVTDVARRCARPRSDAVAAEDTQFERPTTLGRPL